jgi:hypothetical protein
MRRSLLDDPDPFALAPLLALLPVKGDLAKLEGFTSSLYARYESVTAARRRLKGEGGDVAAMERGLALEEAMLKRVLETLSVVGPDGG